MGDIKVYISSISGSAEIKKKQQKIQSTLGENYKGCPIKYVDIATEEGKKEEMRQIAGPTSIPPQFAKGSEYLGDYDAFFEAVENEDIKGFLKC